MSSSIFLTILVLLMNIVFFYIIKKMVHFFARNKSVPYKREAYIIKYFNGLVILISIMALSFIWSVDYSGLVLLASSFFAVAGIALFAQWSIISNITSSIIIFFIFPARIGDRIKITMDGDQFIEGTIKEIALFSILLEMDNGVMSFPNTLLLQRPVTRLDSKKKERDGVPREASKRVSGLRKHTAYKK